MTTPAEILRKYETTPFDLYHLRGKQFIILEDTPRTGKSIREKTEFNEKYKKNQTYYFITIEEGLFHKDLKMTETEMLALFINMPQGIQNLQGAIFKVDPANKYGVSYQGNAAQDINGNPIGNPSNSAFKPPISQPQQPQDQKELFTKQLIEAMKLNSKYGIPNNAQILTKVADGISPGNALELITKSKQEGYITESAGIFVARD